MNEFVAKNGLIVQGNIQATGSIVATSITASMSGTSSNATSASYALTSSYAANSSGGSGTTLTTGSTYQITSSFAVSSSFSKNAPLRMNPVAGSPGLFNNTASVAGQLGVQIDNVSIPSLLVSTTTNPGDFSHGFIIPGGIATVGQTTHNNPWSTGSLMDNISTTYWFLNGSPSGQAASGDSLFTVFNWSTNSLNSGAGLGCAVHSGSGDVTDVVGCAFNHVPNNRVPGLIPGNAMLVFNRDTKNMKGLAICSPSLGGFDAGNYSLLYADLVNGNLRIPRWLTASFQPSDLGWADTLTAYPANGNVVISQSLYVGNLTVTGSVNLTGSFFGTSSYAVTASALNYPVSISLAPTSGNNYTIDLNNQYYSITSSTDLVFASSSNGKAVKSSVVYVAPATASRNLTFNSNWVFLGQITPIVLFSGSNAILSLTTFGSGEPNVIAVWGSYASTASINTLSSSYAVTSSFSIRNVNSDTSSYISGSTGILNNFTSSTILLTNSSSYSQEILSSINNYSEINIQNLNSGNSASTDLIATNNSGSINGNSYYVNLGINNSNYTGSIGSINDSYLFSTASNANFYIGNASPTGSLYIFAGGTSNSSSISITNGTASFNSPNTIFGGQIQAPYDGGTGKASIWGAGRITIGANAAINQTGYFIFENSGLHPANDGQDSSYVGTSSKRWQDIYGVTLHGTNVFSTNISCSIITASLINATSSYANTSSYTTCYRAGQQAIGNLATTQIITFSSILPTTNYAVSIGFDTALGAAVSPAATGKTTGGFTASLSAGIAGGANLDYLAIINL